MSPTCLREVRFLVMVMVMVMVRVRVWVRVNPHPNPNPNWRAILTNQRRESQTYPTKIVMSAPYVYSLFGYHAVKVVLI